LTTEETANSLVRHLRALLRAERLIGEVRLQAVLKRSGLYAAAALLAAFGLAMLNVAGYLALVPRFGEAGAMLAVAIIDFVVAGLLVVIAARVTPLQIEVAEELRDQALAGLDAETRIAVSEVSGFVRRPFQMAGAASILVSIVTTLLRARHRR